MLVQKTQRQSHFTIIYDPLPLRSMHTASTSRRARDCRSRCWRTRRLGKFPALVAARRSTMCWPANCSGQESSC
jgi:hypothetical protein